jgi:fibronectin type 3 domain-containing protein
VGDPNRIYVARGVTRSGRPGPPSTRVQFPVAAVPPPPDNVTAKVIESGIVLEWTPNDKAPTASFNVYRADEPAKQLNPAPLTEAKFEHADVKLGEQQCYRVRSVGLVGKVAVEGDLSDPACATPTDLFPPAAPKGLAAVPTAGQITLIWDANTDKDLAGYLVLRGDAPDGPLQAITAAPIKETSYRDTTVTPGTRYFYAVVAVDTATPANTSAQSPRVEETAR